MTVTASMSLRSKAPIVIGAARSSARFADIYPANHALDRNRGPQGYRPPSSGIFVPPEGTNLPLDEIAHVWGPSLGAPFFERRGDVPL